jgi:hypothetical protein
LCSCDDEDADTGFMTARSLFGWVTSTKELLECPEAAASLAHWVDDKRRHEESDSNADGDLNH